MESPSSPAICNMDAEQALLGAIFCNNQALGVVSGIVRAEYFYEPIHAKIFSLCEDAILDGRAATPITLKGKLPADLDIAGMRPIEYMARLTAEATTVINAPDYARTIRDTWAARCVVDAATAAIAEVSDPGASVKAVISGLLGGLDGIRASVDDRRRSCRPVADGMSALLSRIDAIHAGQVPPSATTGLADLDQMIGRLQGGRLVVVAGRPGMGKAQPLTSRIKLADGSWSTMGDLKFGDRIASVDGRESMVAGIFDQGEKDIFRVTFSDGRSTEACADHLWEVRSCKFSGPRVLATREIAALISRERFQNRLYVPLASGHFGHRKELPMSPWLLGVLIGNGCLLHGRVSVSTADAAILWRVQQVVGATGRVAAGNGYDYGIRGINGENAIMLALRSLGLMGKRSEEKFIPELYLTASREARLELMRGLMDTDGWVEAFGVVRFSTSSQQLARDVADLARSLGGLCTIGEKTPHYEHKGERREGLPHFVCTIRHDTPGELVTLLRKKRRCVRKRIPRLTIRTVEFVGRQQARCISVSHPSRLYVTDNYILTHNTIVGANIARATAAAGNGCLLFSLEMPEEEINARIAADQAFTSTTVGPPVTAKMISEGTLTDAQMRCVEGAAEMASRLPLIIDTSAGLSVGEILAKTRNRADEMRARGVTLRVVVVDYLKFVRASDRYRGQRVYEVGEITAGLKAMAKDLGVCVVLLAQLNRVVEQRADKRPELSDLRDSGDIEADADVVLLLFREAYYLADKTDPDSMARMDAVRHRLEIIVAKSRMGATGVVQVFCHPGASALRDGGF